MISFFMVFPPTRYRDSTLSLDLIRSPPSGRSSLWSLVLSGLDNTHPLRNECPSDWSRFTQKSDLCLSYRQVVGMRQ